MNTTTISKTTAADTRRAKLWRGMAEWSARRSFLLLGIGAAIGLIVAGVGLFTAKGTKINFLPPEDVALVNGQPILVADFDAQLRTTFGVGPGKATMEQKAKTLHDMIREEIYVQRGVELGMTETDPSTRNALVNAVEQQVLAQVTTETPTEKELRAYYDAHRSRYYSAGSMTLTDLLVPGGDTPDALKTASEAAAALRDHTPLAQVITKYNLTNTKKTSGEEFYFAAKIHLGNTLFGAAEKLKAGEVSQPIKIKDGYHVLVMAQNKPSVPLDFAEAHSTVETDYKNDADAELQAQEEKFLMKRAQVQIAGRYQKYECKNPGECGGPEKNIDQAVISQAKADQAKAGHSK